MSTLSRDTLPDEFEQAELDDRFAGGFLAQEHRLAAALGAERAIGQRAAVGFAQPVTGDVLGPFLSDDV